MYHIYYSTILYIHLYSYSYWYTMYYKHNQPFFLYFKSGGNKAFLSNQVGDSLQMIFFIISTCPFYTLKIKSSLNVSWQK